MPTFRRTVRRSAIFGAISILRITTTIIDPAFLAHSNVVDDEEGRTRSGLLRGAHRLQRALPDPANAMETARRSLAGGDLTIAERICQQILSVTPDYGSAWTLLTETALQRGRPEAAIVCANRAVALTPDEPIARIMRAKCLFVSGEAPEALVEAEAAAKIVGAAPAALDALGAIFGLLGLHARAMDLFRGAVAARPDVPQYLFNLAATERITGMLEAAEAHCDAAIALDRTYSLAYYLRSDLRIQTRDRNHIREMERLISERKLEWNSEVTLRFALAKEYEDLEQHARAFDQVAAACALQRRSIKYDTGVEIAEIDRIIRTQTRAWVAACPAGFAAADPVFVVGLPRTGTTLVERIIASHSAMIAAGETGAFAVELRRAMQARLNGLDLTGMSDLGRRYVAAVTAISVPPDRRFIDKTLQNYLYCGIIHAALPRAKIILVRRHPLDTCWSIYKAHFQGKFSFSYDLNELAEYYLAFRRLARHWRATLPSHALLEVSYEDIVRDQAAQSRRLIEFIGLAWEGEVLRFHASTAPSATASAVQVRRPVYASSVGKWRHHPQALEPLRARLVQEIPEAELA
jgi:tetratricopeptide (TPR) repeat protein